MQFFRFYWNIRNYYTPKYAIWTFEQFDWFTLTILWFHITLIYLLWRVHVAHNLPFLVDSIDSSAVCGQLQFLRSMQLKLTLLAVCCIWWVQFEKFTQTAAETVAETVLKFLLLSYLSSFVYVFKLHWFSSYFQEVHQLADANRAYSQE